MSGIEQATGTMPPTGRVGISTDNVENYLAAPEWKDLAAESVLGRSVLVWRRRLRHVLDLLDLAPRSELDFIVQGEQRLTFARFRAALGTVAGQLAGLGVGPADKVLLLLFNRPAVLLAQWALWRAGAVPVFGNRWWSEREIAEVVARVAPRLVITDLALGAATLGNAARVTPDQVEGWMSQPPSAPALDDPRDRAHEDDLAAVVFTAGSSGRPKGVLLSHRNLVWTQQTLHNMQGGRPDAAREASQQTVTLMTVPMFHNGAIVTGIASLIDGNRLIVLRDKFDAEEVMRLIESERVTAWQAVPTMFNRLLQHARFGAYDLSSLIAPASGGTMIPPRLLREVAARLPNAFARFAIGYGMTEMSFITLAMAAQILERPQTVGKPVPGVEIGVSQPNEAGEGELIARSGALMLGYLGETEGPIDSQGWYRTGDLGRLDDEGFVYVTGRVKDMVIRGGENISCALVEAALGEHSQVMEAAVTGYPDEEFGEALAAFIRVRPGMTLEETELRDFARGRLAHFAVPSRWIFTHEPLPVLAAGKLDKKLLAATLAATEPRHG